ncbi:MAG: nitroreductase family protein [Nanoarchaeota archaeon]
MERESKYNIMHEILNRWSPRGFKSEEITDEKLFAILEAARWAPSSYNGQPWRFIYAKRNTEAWTRMFSVLVEFNRQWVKNASAIVLFISKTNYEDGRPITTNQFDTGAAWQNFALEAQHQGYHAHGMSGFDYEKARKELNIPENYDIVAMAAIGKKGDTEDLPDMLKEREQMSDRIPLDELIFEGGM